MGGRGRAGQSESGLVPGREGERHEKLRTHTNAIEHTMVVVLTSPHVFPVARFVKYTGYGNAAGLLAQRGLMCGGRGAEYSSDSEDSDTEEYSALQDKYVGTTFIHSALCQCPRNLSVLASLLNVNRRECDTFLV